MGPRRNGMAFTLLRFFIMYVRASQSSLLMTLANNFLNLCSHNILVSTIPLQRRDTEGENESREFQAKNEKYKRIPDAKLLDISSFLDKFHSA